MLRILNLDDNEAARYVKRRYLASAGHEVLDATCAAEALATLERERVDVALVDMKLPDMSGFELTRRIRANARTRDLPVIQVSAVCVTDEDQRDGMVSGADAYLVPPVERDTLLAMVAEVRKARGSARADHRVRKLDAFIAAHLAEVPDLTRLAGVVGLSPFYFTRMLKRATGLSPVAYLTRARVNEAARLLAETDEPVGRVAARIGCRNAAHFSSLFRRHQGMSPRAWRRHQRLTASNQATEAMPTRAASPRSKAPGGAKRNTAPNAGT
jgi:AraC-like DNA-binding protein